MSGNNVPSPGSSKASLAHRLHRPVDITFLAAFRVMFGAVILWHAWRYIDRGWINQLYVDPKFHFKYYGFEWVKAWPGGVIHIHFFAMAALSAAVAVGFYYRIASVLLCLALWYQLLLDQTRYQNHYYLLALISFLMIWLPAHRAGSIDAVRLPHLRSASVPAWTLWLLRAQIGIPYLFGGITKLNGDWLRGEPVRTMLAGYTRLPLIGPYVTDEWMVLLVAYGGLLIDLFVVPLLLWRRTRAYAFAAAVLFHLLNATLFQVGIFPWFMIAATTVFFSPSWPRKLWLSAPTAFGPSPDGPLTRRQWLTLGLLGLYLTAQILLPLRHFAYPGNVDWSEQGSRFAWRMMIREKRVGIRILVTEPTTNRTFAVDPRKYLTPRQAGRFGMDPDLILQFCHYLGRELSEPGASPVEVRVVALASLNGRKPQLLIDPTLNLAAQRRTLRHKAWIVPLTEPLPEQRWDVPLQRWEEFVEFPAGISGTETREAD
jgi:hypothetical protein